MTNLKLALLFLVSSITLANAQSIQLTPGNLQLGLGLGVVPTFAADQTQTLVPPVSARADVMVANNFALGVYAAYSSVEGQQYNEPAAVMTQFQNNNLMLGMRATAMSNDMSGWRVYGGFMAGANLPDVSSETTYLDDTPKDGRDSQYPTFFKPAETSMIFSGYVGAQRAIGKRFGAYAEAGLGISLFNLGLVYRL
ncbi:MAG: hypothetical protein KDC54_03590 [Lewinella sp.]|nr:hypothetical protein [Lewinella sp.]